MAPETKDQALDLVAAIFVRAGDRLPRHSKPATNDATFEQYERQAA